MLIDTHAHLASSKLYNRIENVIINARKNDIEKIISIGCSIDESEQSIKIAKKFKGTIYATCGLYPHDNEAQVYCDLSMDQRLEKIKALISENHIRNGGVVVAVGECGFDLVRNVGKQPAPQEIERSFEDQTYLFEKQIELAKEFDLPLIIHSRYAKTETVEIIKKHYPIVDSNQIRPNGVWHCFVEDLESANEAISRGFMISVNGLLTYPRMTDLQKTVIQIPLENIIIETDAPYLTPHKISSQGTKLNEPAYVVEVLAKLAELKNMDLEDLKKQIEQNSNKLFFC